VDETVPYGISVDIGTTWVTVHIIDILRKRVVLERVFENPQSVVGLDVVTRIKYGANDASRSGWLTSIIRESINRAVQESLSALGVQPESVKTVVVVGNTVMHHLFYSLPVDMLVRTPYVAETKSSISTKASMVGLCLGKNTVCYSPPVVESYVGPDALAVLEASNLIGRAEPSLMIDIGTNTEVLLQSHKGLWVASAASGPAFEGMAIECGMPAKSGAIFRVKIDRSSLRPLPEVIGNEKPGGICGTGIVSALAEMLRAGIIDSVGSFNRSMESVWLPRSHVTARYLLCQAVESASGHPVYVSQPDVRLVQQSKAAIHAAIAVVLQACGLSPDRIQTVYMTGSFGSQLDLEDAFRIGLFPRFDHARMNQVRGGASIGADVMVWDTTARRRAEKVASSIRYLELLDNAAFEIKYAQTQLFPSGD